MIYHKHLLVNAKVNNAVKSEAQGIEFLRDLVERIDMKIIKGPFASYVNKEGNRGLTGIVMIETSHIAFHIWDEVRPGLVQFDLYTCGELDKDIILEHINREMQIESMDWILFDREDGFKAIDLGAK